MTIYNSALSNKETKLLAGVGRCERWEQDGCTGISACLIQEGIQPELETCDVIYADPPWPAGLKTFNKRAGKPDDWFGWNDFADALGKLVTGLQPRPMFLTVGKRQLKVLPDPCWSFELRLNGKPQPCHAWNSPEFKWDKTRTSADLCMFLGSKYSRMGNPVCGYGSGLIGFKNSKAGNSFVGVDYNSQCIAGMRHLLENS